SASVVGGDCIGFMSARPPGSVGSLLYASYLIRPCQGECRWGQSQVSPLFKRRVDVRLLSRTEFVQILGSDLHLSPLGTDPYFPSRMERLPYRQELDTGR